MRKKKVRLGFSLVEMIICVVILGIVTGGVTLSVQNISKTYDRYAATVTVHDMVVLDQAIEFFYRIFSRYPADLNELLKSGVVVGDPHTYLGDLVVVENKETKIKSAGFKDVHGNLHDLNSFIQGTLSRKK